MRIVWKDSSARNLEPKQYRGYEIAEYENGWSVTLPGDDNIYKSVICAMNAIDQILGGRGVTNTAYKRKTHIIIWAGDKWVKIVE